ncbi:MAG: serine/threonine-protein kinase, partial [Casimicrobiaceae bacterium]
MNSDSRGSGSGQAPSGSSDRGDGIALPKGARLGELEVEAVLGEGGFGIVYLAFDHSLHRHVAVKEYLPGAYAFRRDSGTIAVRSAQHAETFAAGLRSFVQEARLLATFDHPALVRVHRFWEANGTAYMAMTYYRGQTLRDTLKAHPGFANEETLKAIVLPLLDAVTLLHGHNCFHRDISPDNIIVQPDGRPVLLDFGAARRIIGEMTHVLTAVLKPGYAPIEQYADEAGFEQGPWTDVYGFAATLYRAVTGSAPAAAVSRTLNDRYVPLALQRPPGYNLPFLRAIDEGLAVMPASRIQTIGAFRTALCLPDDHDAERTVRVSRTLPPREGVARAATTTPPESRTDSKPQTVTPTAPTPQAPQPAPRVDAAREFRTAPEPQSKSKLPPGNASPSPEAPSTAPMAAKRGSVRTIAIAASVIAAIAVVAAGSWFGTREDHSVPAAPATAKESAPQIAATVATAPVQVSIASADTAKPSAAPAAIAAMPSPKNSQVPVPAAPPSPAAALAAPIAAPARVIVPSAPSVPVVVPAAPATVAKAQGPAQVTLPEPAPTPAPSSAPGTSSTAAASIAPAPARVDPSPLSSAPPATAAATNASLVLPPVIAVTSGTAPPREVPKEESIARSPPVAAVVAEPAPLPQPAVRPAPAVLPPAPTVVASAEKAAGLSGRCNCADLRAACTADTRRDTPGSNASGQWRVDIGGHPACAVIEYRDRTGGPMVKEEVRNGWTIVSVSPTMGSVNV